MSTPPVMKIVPPYTPELLPAAQKYLVEYLARFKRPRVLEYGSGWSTLWFAQLGALVLSFEHDKDWYNEVSEVFRREHLVITGVVVHYPSTDFARITKGLDDEYFDLVYVDCEDSVRIDCCFASLPKLKKGGLLVLDDMHWDMWDGIPERLGKEGFRVMGDFAGQHLRKDGATHFHRTSIYMKG